MFTIRPASLSDAAAISALLQDLTRRFIAPDCTGEGAALLLQAMSESAIAGYIQQPNFDYLLGEMNAELVAVVATRDNSHLYHLFVASHCQGKGYAAKLFAEAKARCLQRADTKIFTVNSSLYALPVYQHLGFVAVGGQRDTQGIRDVPMQLVLTQQ